MLCSVYCVCMPRVDIWIRKDDFEKWTAIEDKPRWIHDALRGTGKEYPKAVRERKEIERILKPAFEALKPKPIVEEIATVFDVKLCKHGASPEFCKYAKVHNGKKVCK